METLTRCNEVGMKKWLATLPCDHMRSSLWLQCAEIDSELTFPLNAATILDVLDWLYVRVNNACKDYSRSRKVWSRCSNKVTILRFFFLTMRAVWDCKFLKRVFLVIGSTKAPLEQKEQKQEQLVSEFFLQRFAIDNYYYTGHRVASYTSHVPNSSTC